MAGVCECNIAAEFPVVQNLGIISANLRTNTEISVTTGGIVLLGPTSGDLSITAYAPLTDVADLTCPGRSGVSFSWEKRLECTETCTFITHFIPRGGVKAYKEGSENIKISMTVANPGDPHKAVEASASSGPSTVYMLSEHYDGYNFSYAGTPISITPSDAENSKIINIFTDSSILPASAELYLQNFSWSYTPPNVPNVSYSFLFSQN